jgi:hypothetical protein
MQLFLIESCVETISSVYTWRKNALASPDFHHTKLRFPGTRVWRNAREKPVPSLTHGENALAAMTVLYFLG